MSASLSFEQKGALRWAVLRFLYERQALAPFPEDSILFHLTHDRRVDFAPAPPDVREALAILQGFAYAEDVADKLSAIRRWRITAEGALAHERDGAGGGGPP
jgi:hypothetical protein